MNHRINNVTDLHNDAKSLYNELIIGGNEESADSILNNLNSGIENLKSSWEGKDAGTQINNVISVYNYVVEIRNKLAKLSENCTLIAASYREIQNTNGGGLSDLEKLNIAEKQLLPEHIDTRDTININEAAKIGKEYIDNARTDLDTFIENTQKYYNRIMDNWAMGPGKQEFEDAFSDFFNASYKYKEMLNNVSNEIEKSLKSYNII